MKSHIFKNRDSLKKEWINYTKSITDIDDEQYLSNTFDKRFKDCDVNIYNSFVGSDTSVNAISLLQDILDKYIIVENGALFLKHDTLLAPCVKTYLALKKLRSFYKNKMKEAKSTGKMTEFNFYNLMQGNTKEAMNTFYGIMINIWSKYYNYDVASATTARGRSTVSMNGLTLEANFGTYRPYSVDAILHFITNAKNKTTKYFDLLENPTDEMLFTHLLQKYRENYYAINIVKDAVSKLSINERKMVYYTSNYRAIMKLPFVQNLIIESLRKQTEHFHELEKLDPTDKDTFTKKYKKIIYIDALSPPDYISTEINTFLDIIHEVLTGFYFYEGYTNEYGEKMLSTQEIFKTIERDKIIITDTDSLIVTIQEEINMVKNIPGFTEVTNTIDKEKLDFIVGSYAIGALSTVIDDGLFRYTTQSLISADYIDNIKYKQEYFFRTIQTTKSAKNYLGTYRVQEGMWLPIEDVELKGLSLKKKNFNKVLSDMAKDIAINDIAKVERPDIKYILQKIKACREEIPRIFKSDKNIEMFTVSKLKVHRDKLLNEPRMDHRFKAVQLYEYLYDDTISIPGAFLVTNITFHDRENDIETMYPEMYKKLQHVVNDRAKISSLKSFNNKLQTLTMKPYAETIINELITNIENCETIDDMKVVLSETKKKYKEDSYVTELIKLLTIKNLKIPDINKIAVPLDAETVDPFITEFIDINDVSIFENLLAVVVQGLGIEVVRNTKKRQVIPNIVSYY